MYKIVGLLENDAKEICQWKYDGEYSIYNYPSWDIVCNQNWAIANETLRNEQFIKVIDEKNNFIGYARFKPEDEKVVLGLGMNPLYCGKGNGNDFMKAVLSTVNNKPILLEVRNFNLRAIKCYERVGFKKVDEIKKDTLIGPATFIVMEKDISEVDYFKEDKYWEKHINMELEDDTWIEDYKDKLPSAGSVLELGCGVGQFSKWFIEHGYEVISSDISKIALEKVKHFNKNVMNIDMREPLPFENNTFNIVFANLSIHYFSKNDTNKLITEIKRILKKDGIFIGSVNGIEGYNAIKDTAKEIEYHYYFNKDKYIRLFDEKDLYDFLNIFKQVKVEKKSTIRFTHNKTYLVFIAEK